MEEFLKSGRGRRCYRIRVLRRDSRSESCRPNRDSADGDQHSSTGLHVVCGSINQASLPGKYSGTQCTSMALTATAWANVEKPSKWTPKTIDEIILAGDALHTNLREASKLSTDPDGRISLDDILGVSQLAIVTAKDTPVYIFTGEYIHSCLCTKTAEEFAFFDVQEWMTTKQGIDNCSGFILTVEQFSYAIFKTEGRWVLFDSHGCLRQSRFNSNHQISWNSAALVVSTSHLEKLLNILHDTHLGLGQCQIMAVNISPMAMTVSPVAHNPCSDNSADTVEATESQAILPEGTQDDAVVGPINERETEEEESCDSIWDTFFNEPCLLNYGRTCLVEAQADTVIPSPASMALHNWWSSLGRLIKV